jgi:hypothetical protein
MKEQEHKLTRGATKKYTIQSVTFVLATFLSLKKLKGISIIKSSLYVLKPFLR